tara:strand:+ start:346 stop:720 length:375 start_codon:yes stop_codon:yes gene_type:complete
MANPSDVGPSGAGTEVLRRVQFNGLSAETVILTVPEDHIYTILLVVVVNMLTSAETFGIYFSPDGSGTCYLMKDNTPIDGNASFVWNDKFVITGQTSGTGDVLKVASSSSNFDVSCSFIDQDFS